MIIFKTLKYKNFLSSGNNEIVISLNSHKHTLIVGQNGSGKSTILDAISFALFGKPHRNINKPQLVNSINKKNSEVVVEFDVFPNSYKIVRGLNPNIFEIWKNGNLLNQESHTKEYQKVLEQNILKMNHKSFHQIVVLGSSSFIPFMQLTQGARREVIEELLDIGVFSKMNFLVKEELSKLKERLTEITHKIEIYEEKKKLEKKHMSQLEKIDENFRQEKLNTIKDYHENVEKLQSSNQVFLDEFTLKTSDFKIKSNSVNDKKNQIVSSMNAVNNEIAQLVKHLKLHENNAQCPECRQDLPDHLKEKVLADSKSKAKNLDSVKRNLKIEYDAILDVLDSLNEESKQLSNLQSLISSNIVKITEYQKMISSLEKEISKKQHSTDDISKCKKELEKIEKLLQEMISVKNKYTEEYNYYIMISEMLKDTGIKTKIIKQYIPVINKLVNQYLQVLDFFVSFTLDESFKEEIKSRHRDTFSYDSFSEGEKQRIDLSLLFTWRQIAKMKNSISTNLLILDETFDSSLDQDGIENLMKILYTLPQDSNTFIISHKGELLDGKFENKMTFEKRQNFSYMIEAR